MNVAVRALWMILVSIIRSQLRFICGELERRSIVTTIVLRKHVGDAHRNRRVQGDETHIPVAARATALDRSRDPTVLLHFPRLHARPIFPFP